VSCCREHPAPVLRTRAGFRRHDAPWRRRGILSELRPIQFLAENGRAALIETDQVKPVLPEIDGYNRWCHIPLLCDGRVPFSERRGRPFHYAVVFLGLLPRRNLVLPAQTNSSLVNR